MTTELDGIARPGTFGLEDAGRSTPLRLLQLYVWLLAVLPARLVVGSIGSFGSPASIVGLLALALWAVSAAKAGALERTVWPVRMALLAMWVPTLISYAVMHLHANPFDEVNGADRALLFLMVWSGVALLAAEGLRGLDDLLRLFRTFVVAAAFISSVAIVQTRFGFDLTLWLAKIPGLSVAGELDSVLDRSGFLRPAGTATHPIELGAVLSTALGIAIVLAVFDTGWKPWRRWTALTVIGLGIPLAISRAGIIGAAIVLVFWVLGAHRVHVTRTLAAAGVFLGALFISTPGLIGTLTGWFAVWGTDQSISTRTDDYPAVAGYIRRSPWIGRGPSTFLPKFRILDNQWLLMLIEVGIIGAIGFAVYLVVPGFLGRSARHRTTDPLWRSMGQALAGASAVAVVVSFTYDSFTFPMFPGLWAVIVGGAGVLWATTRPVPAPVPAHPTPETAPLGPLLHGLTRRSNGDSDAEPGGVAMSGLLTEESLAGDGADELAEAGELGDRARQAFKWSMAAQLVARGGAFAIGLILARLLIPEEYGAYTVALGVFTILLTVDDLGLRQGLVRFVGDFAPAARTAQSIAIISGVVWYTVAYFAAPVVADITSTPDVTGLIRLLCVGLLIDTVLHIVPSAALQRRFRQDLFAVTELSGLAVDFALTVTLASTGHGAWSLVWGSLAGQLTRALLSMRLAHVRFAPRFHRPTAHELLAVSAPFAGASFVGALLLNIDYLIIGNILGAAAVGVYLVAFNVSSWPISLVGTAVRAVAVPGFAQMRAAQRDVAATFCRGLALLAAGGLPFVVLLTSIPETLITALYGAEWAPGAEALQLLGALAMVRLLGGLVDDLLFALGRSSWILLKNAVWIALLAPAIAIGARVGELRGVGMAQALVASLVIFPMMIVMVRRMGMWRRPLLANMPLLLPGAIAAGLLGWAIDQALDVPAFVAMTVVGTVELAVYLAWLIPLRRRLLPSVTDEAGAEPVALAGA